MADALSRSNDAASEASLIDLAARLAGARLSERNVTVIGLDAIAERLGERWPTRRQIVLDHLERGLRTHLAPDSWFAPLTDRELIVAQLGAAPGAGQILCLNVLRETVQHFLGRSVAADLSMHVLTRVTPEGLFGEKLTVAAIEALLAPPPLPPAPAPRSDVGMVTTSGRRIRIACSLETVVQLATQGEIGQRVRREVTWEYNGEALAGREWDELAPGDVTRIDLAAMEQGVRLLGGEATQTLTALVTLSHRTLAAIGSRAEAIVRLDRARAAARHGVICEVAHVVGAPSSAVQSAVSAVRPHCLYLLAAIGEAEPDSAAGLIGSGFRGVTAEHGARDRSDSQFIDWTKRAVSIARQAGKCAVLYDVPSPRHARVAAELGCTHGSMRPPPSP